MRAPLAGLLVSLALTACAVDPLDEGDDGEDFSNPTASVASELRAPASDSLSFARVQQERILGVRIYGQRHNNPRVVYSVRLDGLARGETLRMRGEVTLSRCNPNDLEGTSGDSAQSPCNNAMLRNNPYAYDPNFSAAYVIGTAPGDASGARVGEWVETRCTRDKHHCAAALPEASLNQPSDGRTRYLNLVVSADASGANARAFDVMEVEQSHGGLYVTRVGASARPRDPAIRTTQVQSGAMPIFRNGPHAGSNVSDRRQVFRVRLDGLRGGEVVSVGASMRVRLGSYDTVPLVLGTLLLAADAQAVDDGRNAWEITPHNGHNCADHSSSGCRYEESGAIEVPRGAPSTLYAIYYAQALRSDAASNGSERVTFVPNDGAMEVRVQRP